MPRIPSVLLILLLPCITEALNDDLYILIDEISVFNCRGVKNEIKIGEEDVQIVNEKGNKVYYIHAPGNYSLHFKKIKVQRDFGFLAGELGITLQVPVIEGPAGIRFDLPYTVVPETGLLTQQCDDHSGVVERNGRQYCRYCDLCTVGEKIERELTSGTQQFLKPTENDIKGARCGHIGADEYEIKRNIQLPNRSALENLIRTKVHGVDSEIKKRLNKGRGRFQVFMNLITSEKPPISKSKWFDGSKECTCCLNQNAPGCDSLSYLYCNIEDCKTGWALQCLHNTARIAACYTVEFNYRMTTSYSDVMKFLQENNYPNQDTEYGQVQRTTPEPTQSPRFGPSAELQKASQNQMTQACVAAMSPRLTHLRRYCTIFWNEKLCCSHCSDIC